MSVVEVLGLVAGVVALVVAPLALALLAVRRRARRTRTAVLADADGDARRTENVRGLGLESRGPAQVRGNGWLVLTDDELRFRQWVPDRETRVPLAAVTSVGPVRTWLGKWVGEDLLCVRWRTEAGTEDAMAWQVADLDGWLAALPAGAAEA